MTVSRTKLHIGAAYWCSIQIENIQCKGATSTNVVDVRKLTFRTVSNVGFFDLPQYTRLMKDRTDGGTVEQNFDPNTAFAYNCEVKNILPPQYIVVGWTCFSTLGHKQTSGFCLVTRHCCPQINCVIRIYSGTINTASINSTIMLHRQPYTLWCAPFCRIRL